MKGRKGWVNENKVEYANDEDGNENGEEESNAWKVL